ncbi:ferric iron ABC transporter membrane-spanning permease [Streptococcus pneumoniae]|uniref:iron chelate uptake ABC transporter family permease subunit n=1 Tax=Streptococcus pneumoniae TaxID=1313 RepID=UPI0005DB9EEC|nr:iron chelate uptake ABC transporter family permease subunit [Streptococcus pneumoniae]CKA54295.1 ferric iron ABC transporter membrane-spanning permease [Streptococcus pneumoniae]
MQTKSKHTKLFWILIILAIGACLLYFWPITHLSAFAWKLRSQKIIVYLLVAIGSLIILALTIFFFRKAVVLDVLHLQRETAQILGLDVEKEQKELLWGIVLLTSTATALVGPMAFFGFMLANLTYLIVKDYQHKLLFIVAILVGFISLTLGQALIERVFALEIRISMIIESVGGFLFFILLYRRARQ